MQHFMAMYFELANGMSDERLAESIAELESGRKMRVTDYDSPTGFIDVAPIVLQVFKRVQESRKATKQ
jgi:hypothetical protein